MDFILLDYRRRIETNRFAYKILQQKLLYGVVVSIRPATLRLRGALRHSAQRVRDYSTTGLGFNQQT